MKVPWFGYLHPLLSLATLVYGLRIAQVSLTRINDWDYPLRQQRNRTIAYFLFCVANFLLGLLFASLIRGRGTELALPGHMALSFVVLGVTAVATVVTFGKTRMGEVAQITRIHPVLMVISLTGVLTLAFLTGLRLFGI
jgi:hypothetical protein